VYHGQNRPFVMPVKVYVRKGVFEQCTGLLRTIFDLNTPWILRTKKRGGFNFIIDILFSDI